MTQEAQRRRMVRKFCNRINKIQQGTTYEPLDEEFLDGLLFRVERGLSARQAIITATKWMHGFNITDVRVDTACMLGEFTEFLEASNGEDLYATATELADIVIYCYGISEMLGCDLDKIINTKMDYNIRRSYYK